MLHLFKIILNDEFVWLHSKYVFISDHIEDFWLITSKSFLDNPSHVFLLFIIFFELGKTILNDKTFKQHITIDL